MTPFATTVAPLFAVMRTERGPGEGATGSSQSAPNLLRHVKTAVSRSASSTRQHVRLTATGAPPFAAVANEKQDALWHVQDIATRSVTTAGE